MYDVAMFPPAILVCHIPLATEPLWALLVATEVKVVVYHILSSCASFDKELILSHIKS